MTVLLTLGHGTADRAALEGLLTGAGVDLLVDVRRYPDSRRNADVRREALAGWLPEAGIDYRWEQRLGGRRHLRAGEPVLDPWWTVAAFQAYAAYTRSPDFAAAWADVLTDARSRSVAVMCSESLWWRCHRRLIADVAVLADGLAVEHLYPNGRREPHRPAAGARVTADRTVIWDGR